MKTTEDGSAAAAAKPDDVRAIWAELDEEDGASSAQDEPEAVEEAADIPDDEGQEEEEPAARPASRTPDPAPDIWANASPEMIAWRDQIMGEKAAMEQRTRSEAGRLAAYQRRYEEAKAQLDAAQKQTTEEPEDDSDLTAAAEEYPDVVNPLLKRLDRQNAAIEAMMRESRSRDDIAAAERDAHMAAEEAKVTAAHPGWVDLTTRDDGAGGRTAAPEFVAWVNQQTPEMRAKVDRNADGITSAAEATEVIAAFSAFMDRIKAASNPPADPRRQRQLNSSRAVTSRPQVATTTGIPKHGEPSAIWAELDRIEEAEARRGNR